MNHEKIPCVAFSGVMALVVMGTNSHAGDGTLPPALYSQLEAFHGHVCVGAIFGARLGLAAKEALKEAGGTGKFTAKYYDLSCPVDAFRWRTDTTYGNKALTLQERDEHRLVLTASGNKRAVDVHLTKMAEELGLKSRDLGTKAKALATGSPERLDLEREIEDIYAWLKTAPTREVVSVTYLSGTKASR